MYKEWIFVSVIAKGAASEKDEMRGGAGIGSGFPLGRRSTKLDVAIQAGVRKSDNDSIWNEKFVGIAIGLTGVGNWGNKPKKVH